MGSGDNAAVVSSSFFPAELAFAWKEFEEDSILFIYSFKVDVSIIRIILGGC